MNLKKTTCMRFPITLCQLKLFFMNIVLTLPYLSTNIFFYLILIIFTQKLVRFLQNSIFFLASPILTQVIA